MKSSLLLCGARVAAGAQYPGWSVPPGGASEKSPLTATPTTIARGKEPYAANCARCHGPDGQGGGPESAYAADLTDDLRIELNTEGVLFYKIWKGRVSYGKGPKEDMPAFEGKLEKAPGVAHEARDDVAYRVRAAPSLVPGGNATLPRHPPGALAR